MLKSTFVRQCAHNLNERNQVEAALSEKNISRPRKQYLNNQLIRLKKERAFFAGIKKEFLIRPSDCFKL